MADAVTASEAAAAEARQFSFTLTSVRAVRDSFGPGGHVFLIPDGGAASIRDLRSRLYSGVLHQALRADIPYVPHITVAADSRFERCEALAGDGHGVHWPDIDEDIGAEGMLNGIPFGPNIPAISRRYLHSSPKVSEEPDSGGLAGASNNNAGIVLRY